MESQTDIRQEITNQIVDALIRDDWETRLTLLFQDCDGQQLKMKKKQFRMQHMRR